MSKYNKKKNYKHKKRYVPKISKSSRTFTKKVQKVINKNLESKMYIDVTSFSYTCSNTWTKYEFDPELIT